MVICSYWCCRGLTPQFNDNGIFCRFHRATTGHLLVRLKCFAQRNCLAFDSRVLNGLDWYLRRSIEQFVGRRYAVFFYRYLRSYLPSFLLERGPLRTGLFVQRSQDCGYQGGNYHPQRTLCFSAIACAFAGSGGSKVKGSKHSDVQGWHGYFAYLCSVGGAFRHFVFVGFIIKLRYILCFGIFRRSAKDTHILYRGRISLFRGFSDPGNRILRVSCQHECCVRLSRVFFVALVNWGASLAAPRGRLLLRFLHSCQLSEGRVRRRSYEDS